MPIYEYHCKKCGELIEVMRKITDTRPVKCKGCGSRMEKQISNTTFVLKGSGWYATDYGRKDGTGMMSGKENSRVGKDEVGSEDIAKKKEESAVGKGEEGKKDSSKKSAVAPAK